MPDVGMLLELADFYGVDIREIIDGERKSEMTGRESTDTIKKVAAYATEKEKDAQSKVVYAALGISIALFVCTILFASERAGLLYGIVPTEVCDFILVLVYGFAAGLLVFYLRIRWWLEKPTQEPRKSVAATVLSKEVQKGTGQSGRSQGGYSFVITFLTEDNQVLALYAYDTEYGGLQEGMKGILTYRGRYFVDFTQAPD